MQERVALLDPEVRCFSDTPAWLEANQHRLANRRILMYCTGGVRWAVRQAAHSRRHNWAAPLQVYVVLQARHRACVRASSSSRVCEHPFALCVYARVLAQQV